MEKRYMQLWDESQSFNQQATFKIAIASSTIFAGIVGSEKLTYDYWGDGILFIIYMLICVQCFHYSPGNCTRDYGIQCKPSKLDCGYKFSL